MQEAKHALENPRLTGEAVIKEAGSGAREDQNTPPNQGFDMGQVVPHACLYPEQPFRLHPKAERSNLSMHSCSRIILCTCWFRVVFREYLQLASVYVCCNFGQVSSCRQCQRQSQHSWQPVAGCASTWHLL